MTAPSTSEEQPDIRYYAELTFGRAVLTEIEVLKETAFMLRIGQRTNIISHSYLSDNLRKDKVHIFDTLPEALEYLSMRMEQRIEEQRRHLASLEEEHGYLRTIIEAADRGEDIKAHADEILEAYRNPGPGNSGPLAVERTDNQDGQPLEGRDDQGAEGKEEE